MATDKLIDAFECSRRLGFHDIEQRPEHGSRNERDYLRAANTFRNARLRGNIPPPDVIRGQKTYLWRESTIKRWIEDNGYAKRVWSKNKKARQRANAAEPKAETPSQNEASAAEKMPRRARPVKREPAAVANG